MGKLICQKGECRFSTAGQSPEEGVDNVGVLICEAPYKQDSIMLALDIGTNGELLLGDRRRVISSPCATGPTLEGAHIEFGMRAAPGSIEKVEIDPVTKEPRYKVIGQDTWNDEMPKEEIQGMAWGGIGYLFVALDMNNHWQGQAVGTARPLKMLMEGEGD